MSWLLCYSPGDSPFSGIKGTAELHFPAPPAPGSSELHTGLTAHKSAVDKVRQPFPSACCRFQLRWLLEHVAGAELVEGEFRVYRVTLLWDRCGH